jgi:hypothetical protein
MAGLSDTLLSNLFNLFMLGGCRASDSTAANGFSKRTYARMKDAATQPGKLAAQHQRKGSQNFLTAQATNSNNCVSN